MTDQRTRRFFDRKADDYYDEMYEHPADRHAFNLTLRRDACLQLLAARRGPILDLGCGPGAMTIPLLARGEEVVSIDLSRDMVEQTSKRVQRMGMRATAAQASATALPFAESCFDAVVSTGVLEYVPELDAALREVARVLRPDGIFVGTMSMPRRLERIMARAYARVRGRSVETTQFIYDRTEFDVRLTSAGFSIIERTSCAFLPFPLDAVWPPGMVVVDRAFSKALNRSDFACDRAKTYIVKARLSATSKTA